MIKDLIKFLNSRNSGFTLIELLIVIGIITLLSTMAIFYSHTGERQIILFQEQVKILNAISRAKSLSINTFNQQDVPCGFGVHFDSSNGSFIIFKELATKIDCSNVDFQYSGESEDFEVFNLNSFIVFDSLTLDDIIFFPPEPIIAILPDFQEEATISLKIIGSTEPIVIIKVNKFGMITTQ